MKTAAEYRVMADECFQWAREAKAKEVRVSLQQLAQVWLNAASKLDGLPPNQRNQRLTPRKRRRPEQSEASDFLIVPNFGVFEDEPRATISDQAAQ